MAPQTAASDVLYQDPPVRATVRDWAGLAVLSLAVLLVAVDGTVLDVAIPFMSEDLAPTSTQLLWVIDIYSFVLAALLVTMGTLGDRIGRRRLLMIGSTGFGLASVLAASATDPTMLIAARALQGVAGATLMPSTLGLIRSMFRDRHQRTMAIGVWGAMWGGGAAAGPLVGGWLLEHFWWGSVFLINLPVMVVLVTLAPWVIPESRDPNPGRFDLISAGLSMVAMVPIVYAIKEIAMHGFSWGRAAFALVGLVAGWAFVRRQRRLAAPLLDVTLFRRPAFSTAVLTNLLSVFALAGVMFFGSQYLQLVLGYRPLEAGLLMLPEMLASVVSALLVAPLVGRWGARVVLSVSLGVAAAGALVLVGLRADGGLSWFLVGSLLIGLGVGLALTLTSDLVVSAVEPERAGAASAVSETASELGIALGVAVLGSIVMAMFRGGLDVAGLTAGQADAARDTLGGAMMVAEQTGDALVASANHAFVGGMHVAALLTGVILAAVAVLSAIMLRPREER
ncbi:MFS transporter [Speluncibacter jeojiensis]|uniref:MFS transporter n=1 Tax=Speluncibacter jeojiensis TaxID=2710754 RepID=UPI0039F52833